MGAVVISPAQTNGTVSRPAYLMEAIRCRTFATARAVAWQLARSAATWEKSVHDESETVTFHERLLRREIAVR